MLMRPKESNTKCLQYKQNGVIEGQTVWKTCLEDSNVAFTSAGLSSFWDSHSG
jgi:hypothetical protein